MNTVQILLSSYNGEKVINRQVESILKQENVDVHLLIRDDGSNDSTVIQLEKLKKKYPHQIEIITGKNMGWKKSFIELLFHVSEYDYYGFSDQDDLWDKRKIISSIKAMERDDMGVKLCQCGSVCVDENLQILSKQEIAYKSPRTKKRAIAQEYFRGCCMLWNSQAMDLIKRYKPNENIAHDYWVGLICFYFGKLYYCPEKLLYHIRYPVNSSTDGNLLLGRINRLKTFFTRNVIYMNPNADLLYGYEGILEEKDKNFLQTVCDYKKSFKKRMKVFWDWDFRRESLKSTLLFKATILFGKY